MALELVRHYFSYWLFSLIHGFLIIAAVMTVLRGRRAIRQHIAALVQGGQTADVGDRDAAETTAPDRAAGLAGDDPWLALQRLHARPKRPAFSEVHDHYGSLIGGYTEDLARFVNVLLLTGVAGTLYGLYRGTTTSSGVGTWTDALAAPFQAFGVTIAAVVLAGFVILLQRGMARFCDRSEVSIAALWADAGGRDPAGPVDGVIAVVDKLQQLSAQFTPIVDRMKEHSDRILRDSEGLDKVAASCDLFKKTVDGLPASLHDVMTRSQAGYLQALRDNAEAMQVNQVSALSGVQKLVESARQAHAAYLAGLTNIQQRNGELFEQVRETNRSAFKAIEQEIANFAERLNGLDGTAGAVIAEFGNRLTKALNAHVSALDARLTTLLSVAPDVERNLQQLQPSSVAAVKSVRDVEALSLEAIGQVQNAVKGLAGSLVKTQTQLDRVASTQDAIVRPRPDPIAPPAKTAGGRALVVVGLAAGLGTFLTWFLLRVAG